MAIVILVLVSLKTLKLYNIICWKENRHCIERMRVSCGSLIIVCILMIFNSGESMVDIDNFVYCSGRVWAKAVLFDRKKSLLSLKK